MQHRTACMHFYLAGLPTYLGVKATGIQERLCVLTAPRLHTKHLPHCKALIRCACYEVTFVKR